MIIIQIWLDYQPFTSLISLNYHYFIGYKWNISQIQLKYKGGADSLRLHIALEMFINNVMLKLAILMSQHVISNWDYCLWASLRLKGSIFSPGHDRGDLHLSESEIIANAVIPQGNFDSPTQLYPMSDFPSKFWCFGYIWYGRIPSDVTLFMDDPWWWNIWSFETRYFIHGYQRKIFNFRRLFC